MTITLPDSLIAFVDKRVADGSFATASDLIADLLNREKDRLQLRNMMLEAASSPVVATDQDEFFAELRQYAEDTATKVKKHGT